MKETIQLITTDGSVLFEHTQQNNSITKTLYEFINVQNHKNLPNIDLSNQNLEGLSFKNMNLIGANFKSANLKNVTFDCANLVRVDFSNAHLTYSSFRHTYLNTANFKDADLSGCVLNGADLGGCILNGADLSGANLNCAALSNADLRRANLNETYLSEANLKLANLEWATLKWADLRGVDLRGANLNGAYLSGADLRGANLRWANLYAADLRQTKLDGVLINEGTQFFAFQCPSEGSFIGWKKAGTTIIKLLIPEDAQRSSATTLKCRCSKAKVLDIQNLDGSKYHFSQVQSNYDSNFIYEIGKIVEVTNFDENRWEECSSGIHFFMSREIAVNY